jgi:hypothetical protein
VPVLLYWFEWQEESPKPHDLPRYVQLSTSSSVDFITHLTLHKVWMFRASDLMALAEMPNLGILELSDLFGQAQHNSDEVGEVIDSVLSDRLVRGWSEKERPFPNLRILLVTSVHSSITLLTLQYASSFPSLVYCGLRSVSLPGIDLAAKRTAKHFGWRLNPWLDPWKEIDGPMPLRRSDGYLMRRRETRRKADRRNKSQLEVFDQSTRAGVFLSPFSTAEPRRQIPDDRGLMTFSTEPEIMEPQLNDYISWHYSERDSLQSLPWMMSGWNIYSALGEQIGNVDLLEQGVLLQHRATHVAPSIGCKGKGESVIPGVEAGDSWNGQEILPPKQMLNLVLGCARDDYLDLHGSFYYPGDYNSSLKRRGDVYGDGSVRMKVYTFVRDYTPTMSTSSNTGEDTTRTTSNNTAFAKTDLSSSGSTKRKESGGGSTFKPRKRRDLDDLFGFGTGKGADC